MALLQIEDLRTEIQLKNGVVHAVDGVSLHVDEGETLGIVGESGCGKTMTALSIMDLLPERRSHRRRLHQARPAARSPGWRRTRCARSAATRSA